MKKDCSAFECRPSLSAGQSHRHTLTRFYLSDDLQGPPFGHLLFDSALLATPAPPPACILLRRGYRSYFLIHALLEKYARRFWIRIEQVSIQGDHIHLLIRAGKRSNYQAFFRVTAGQIAQRFQNLGLVTDTPKDCKGKRVGDQESASSGKKLSFWRHRPFTRVVRGGKRAYQNIRNYIQLNVKEAIGEIKYKKNRLKGLNEKEWQALWS